MNWKNDPEERCMKINVMKVVFMSYSVWIWYILYEIQLLFKGVYVLSISCYHMSINNGYY